MGKSKGRGVYNEFLDGEKLRDNTEVRTSLQHASSLKRQVSPPPTQRARKGRGKKGKGGPKKPQLTHFLCLPLVNEKSQLQMERELEKLKEELGSMGLVPLQAVRPVGALHLTLGVMSLDADQLEAAKQYLQELDLQRLLRDITAQAMAEKAAQEGTVSENLSAYAMPDAEALTIQIRGLVPMQAPQKTSILYAEPTDGTERLLRFGEKLKHLFTRDGFMVEDKRSLRLHATIINTIYAKPKRGGTMAEGQSASGGVDGAGTVNQVDGTGQHDDGASTAASTQDGHEEITTAPPDPSTAETEVKAVANLDGTDGHGPNAKSWLRFDARELIDRFREVVWAEDVRIDRVQICKMGAKKIFTDGGELVGEEYEVVGEKVIGT